ncbi:hypothetical protein G4B88_022217 [Cannabis sativa]|uniref:Uncharacterized protein n=1 Tax=Cannabis sativa TaxID=3483 RepID=A0A7J6G0I9_CANSA|nr:hypothetical protein G4B88_022217 [Cannabis sativa]
MPKYTYGVHEHSSKRKKTVPLLAAFAAFPLVPTIEGTFNSSLASPTPCFVPLNRAECGSEQTPASPLFTADASSISLCFTFLAFFSITNIMWFRVNIIHNVDKGKITIFIDGANKFIVNGQGQPVRATSTSNLVSMLPLIQVVTWNLS